MEYTKLFNLLDNDQKTQSFITNLSSGFMEVPYLVSETLNLLSDDSVFYNMISDANKKCLCNMLNMYFNTSWYLYMGDDDLSKLLKYGKNTIYKIEASEGLRYATTNEVAQGVRGLIPEDVYIEGRDEYKMLCLLQWSFTGMGYYYRQAGFNLAYDADGKVTTTFFQMIFDCAGFLKTTMEWAADSEKVEKAISKLKKAQRGKSYKYASYAKDEVTEDITIKQLVYNIHTIFPRNSDNKDYRKGLALALKVYKGNKMLQPHEISWLREVYDKFVLDNNVAKQNQDTPDKELKDICEKILNLQYSGKINQRHFAYTIIETLKKNNYTKCSGKQYEVIRDAANILGLNKTDSKTEDSKETKIITEDEIDMQLDSLSDAIANGLLEEDEE